MRQRVGQAWLVLGLHFLVWITVGCSGTPGSRYQATRFTTTRASHLYVRDRQTGRWVNRECEVRVSVSRALPEPLVDNEQGTRLSLDMFRPRSVESGGLGTIGSDEFELRDGYRVWRTRHVIRGGDLTDGVAYGIQVRWLQAGQPTRYEPLELFPLAAPGSTPPDTWSAWWRATDLRDGAFAWWREAHGKRGESAAPPEHPFEVRCRVYLQDTPGYVD